MAKVEDRQAALRGRAADRLPRRRRGLLRRPRAAHLRDVAQGGADAGRVAPAGRRGGRLARARAQRPRSRPQGHDDGARAALVLRADGHARVLARDLREPPAPGLVAGRPARRVLRLEGR